MVAGETGELERRSWRDDVQASRRIERVGEREQVALVRSAAVMEHEERELGPGETWRIPSNTPHEVHTGPEGAAVIDVFGPPRDDWDALEVLEPRPPLWP